MICSKRTFLRIGTGAAAGAVLRHAFGAKSADIPLAFTGPVIDTHTHFYDPTRAGGVPWPPSDDKLLYRRVLPADYRALSQPISVTGTIVVEASPWVEDNQWILDLAANDPFIQGFVGNLAVGTDGFQANLKRFARNPLFRGLRIGADRMSQGMDRTNFIEDLELLSRMDLALDLLGGPEMLPAVAKMAGKVPNLRLIIDHVANLRIDGKVPDQAWQDGMRALAPHKNVSCKVSGLVEGSGRTDGKAPATVDFYRPVLDVIWEVFGSDRSIYGSNWPVSERFAPCAIVQQIVYNYFKDKGSEPLQQVFSKNAGRVYKPAH